MNIGEYIREKRKEAGLTVDELAAKIGKNRATIYRYENNSIESLPSDILIPLANALSITPGDLIKRNPNAVATDNDATHLSPAEAELVKNFRLLDDVGKATVTAVIKVQLKRIHE